MSNGQSIKYIYDELFDTYKKKLIYLKTYYNDNKDIEIFEKYLKVMLTNDLCNRLIDHYSFYSGNGHEYTIIITSVGARYKIYIGFNLMDFTYIQCFVNMFADDTQYYLRKESI